jgi:hypothetical protein
VSHIRYARQIGKHCFREVQNSELKTEIRSGVKSSEVKAELRSGVKSSEVKAELRSGVKSS